MAEASTSGSGTAVPLSPAKQGTSATATTPLPASSSSLFLQNAGSFRIRAPVTVDSDSSDFDSNASDFSDGNSAVADDDDEGFETEGSVIDTTAGTPESQRVSVKDEAFRPVVARVVVEKPVALMSLDDDEEDGEFSDVSDGENGVFPSVIARVPGLETKARVRVQFLEIKEEEEGTEVDGLSDSGTVIGAPNETSDSVNVTQLESSLDDDSGSAVVDESSEVLGEASMVKEQIYEEKILIVDEEDEVNVKHCVTTAEPEVQEMVGESSGENMGCERNESDSGIAVEEEEAIVVAPDAGSATRPNNQSVEQAENTGIESFEEEEVEEGMKFLLSDPGVSQDLTFEDCSIGSHTLSSKIPDFEVDPTFENQSLELPENGGTELSEEVENSFLMSDQDVNKDWTVEDCSSDSHTMSSGRIADMELDARPNQSLEFPENAETESFGEEVESKKVLPSDVDIEDLSFKGFEGCIDLQTNNGQTADMKIETGTEVKRKQLFESDGSRSSSFTISSSDMSRQVSPVWSTDTGSSFDGISPLPANSAKVRLIEDEKKDVFQNNQHLIIKLLRLINGCSLQDPIAAQVMHNLSGIYGSQELSFETTERLAMEVETGRRDNLNLSLNILVIGKTGVGKSSTINSIFGEKKVSINAFEPATTVANEVSGTVNGIRIRILDTPGLRSSFKDASTNRKILSSVKKLVKSFPPDVVLYVDRLDDLTGDETTDVTLLREVTKFLTPSIWDKAIVVLTHASSSSSSSSLPPEEDGPLSFEGFIARRCFGVQHAIGLAVGDQLLVHPGNWKPVALAENQKEKYWTAQLLHMCCLVKILSEATHFVDPGMEAVKKKSVDTMDSAPLTLMRRVLDVNEWDGDCGCDDDRVAIERNNLSITNEFPSAVTLQLTKDKNHFNVYLDSSVLNRSTTIAGLDRHSQTNNIGVGNFKVNKTAFGMSIAIMAVGMKLEDESRSRSSLSWARWKRGLGVIGSLQREMELGRGSKVGVSVWMNNKKRGRIRVTSSSLELQLAMMEIVPAVIAVLGRICCGGSIRN